MSEMRLLFIWRSWARNLTEPRQAFARLERSTFDDLFHEYLWLLLGMSLGAGLYSLLLTFGQALYVDIIRNVDINYLRLLNYAAQQSLGVLVFSLFAGTFLLFLLSIILRPFTRRRYHELLLTLFLSVAPVLLFGWLYQALPGLLIWSCCLYAIGSRRWRGRKEKGTLRERE